MQFILVLIDQQPNIYLEENAEELIEQHNVSVSLATIQWMIKLLGLTTKKGSAAEHCEDAWQYFLYRIGQESPCWLVFGDESAINLLTWGVH
ncbi:hypothetical protein K439DRAFT_1360595 [Ramaria rubella]|nr:hypothetical protein K439DRAFT_1360595 [Ramaria rubella]